MHAPVLGLVLLAGSELGVACRGGERAELGGGALLAVEQELGLQELDVPGQT